METKHTPTPWNKMGTGNNLHGSNGDLVMTYDFPVPSLNRPTEESSANTDFIIRACNAYDAFINAAEVILEAIANNSAPINPFAALRELAIENKHITLHAGLVLNLLKSLNLAERK